MVIIFTDRGTEEVRRGVRGVCRLRDASYLRIQIIFCCVFFINVFYINVSEAEIRDIFSR